MVTKAAFVAVLDEKRIELIRAEISPEALLANSYVHGQHPMFGIRDRLPFLPWDDLAPGVYGMHHYEGGALVVTLAIQERPGYPGWLDLFRYARSLPRDRTVILPHVLAPAARKYLHRVGFRERRMALDWFGLEQQCFVREYDPAA